MVSRWSTRRSRVAARPNTSFRFSGPQVENQGGKTSLAFDGGDEDGGPSYSIANIVNEIRHSLQAWRALQAKTPETP